MKRVLLTVLLVYIILLAACGSPPAETITVTAPPITVTAPPITITKTIIVSEPPIPAHFTAYTDEVGLFSISYPPDWELALSLIEDLEQFSKEYIESIESGIPLGSASAIFFAGVPTEMGYLPNVGIVVEPLPDNSWTLDEFVEAAWLQLELHGIESNKVSQFKTTVGGREAVIIDYEADIPEVGRFHYLVMSILVDNIAWTVTCASAPEKFNDFEDEFYDIVRSLRILK